MVDRAAAVGSSFALAFNLNSAAASSSAGVRYKLVRVRVKMSA